MKKLEVSLLRLKQVKLGVHLHPQLIFEIAIKSRSYFCHSLIRGLQETIPPTNAFNRNFLDLLRRIFVYDPKTRLTAKQALAHPWFRDTIQDDGTEAMKIRLSRQVREGCR